MEGLQPLTRENYVGFVISILWENFPQIIGGGVFLSVATTPAFVSFSLGLLAPTILLAVIFVAPAWAALLAFDGLLLCGKAASLSQLFRLFGERWRAATLLGMILALPLLTLLQLLPLLPTKETFAPLWLAVGGTVFLIMLAWGVLLYAFPLLGEQGELSFRFLQRAWFLTGRAPFHTVGLLAMALLFLFAVVYISLGLLLLLPAIYALFVAANFQLIQATPTATGKA